MGAAGRSGHAALLSGTPDALNRPPTPENAMRNKLLATLITGVFLSLAAQAMDLLQAYQQALANDPVHASARASLTAGQENIPQGRAGLLPTLGVGGSYNRNDISSDFSGITTDSTANTNSYTISLSQPLFRPANWEQYQEGKLSSAASEAQFAQAQQDLIVRVSQAYFDVLAAQDALASVQAQKVAITEQLASAKRNFEVGTATITDTHVAQARFDLAVAQEYAAINDLEIKRAALQQIIGKPAGDLAGLKPGFKLSAPQPADINQWVQSAETQNYGVIGQQLGLEIAQREIKRNRAGHYPPVDLGASNGLAQVKALEAAEVSSQSALESNRLGYQVGVRINIDVLNAQQQLYTTRRDLAKARYDTVVNGLKLRSAAGTLKEDDVVQINHLLGPSSASYGIAPSPAASAQGTANTAAGADKQTATAGVADEVLAAVNDWAKAWSARDADRYFSFYSKEFKPAGGQSKRAWAAQRRVRIETKKQIEVGIEAPEVSVNGDTATVKFRQRYRAGKTRSVDNQLLTLIREDGAWRSTRETTY